MYNHLRSRPRGFGARRSFGANRRSVGNQKNINPTLFVNKAVDLTVQIPETITHRFSDFAFDQRLLQRVQDRGYLIPTPIQDKTIPLIMRGRDVIGIADTGTGKTAAFVLPLIHKFLQDRSQKVLIIVPTRELAVQIDEELKTFAQGLQIFSALCIGGCGYGSQINALRRRPQFIIGTPGRLKDHLSQRTLRLDDVNNLVLDEADRMVEMGFINDVTALIDQLPKSRQSLFFSATITPEVQQLIAAFTANPEAISVKNRETSQNVDQDVVHYAGPMQKLEILHDLLIKDEFKKVLIFGRTKHGVEKLNKVLVERGFKALPIHGNKSQSQRQRSLNDFKDNRAQILVATDVAARGLDIPNVTHVINYDVPENYSEYIHRIGRTGRADKKGQALTFVEKARV